MRDDERELTWLRRVRDLSHLLASERDVRRLLPLILDAGVELAEAERGFLVRLAGRDPRGRPKIKVEVARGFDKAALEGPEAAVSRSVVARVVEGGAGLVSADANDEVLRASSLRERAVLAVLCAPLRLRGELRGVLYLDHRRGGAFAPGDLPLVQAFADQAALALETADLLGDRGGAGWSESGLHELEQLSEREEQLGFGRLVGRSPAMLGLYAELERAARGSAPALILGEPGAGKARVARELHERSDRAGAPFVAVDCQGLAGRALESELLGHRRGAFPGAGAAREGALRLAGAGTVYLREVTALPLELQGQLGRALSQALVRPVGARADAPIRCRVLAGTARDPREEAAAGRLLPALHYRLDVHRLPVPPLRERPGDAALLLRHFAREAGAPDPRLSPTAADRLAAYAWPGNVRELRNEATRLIAQGAREVTARQLAPEIREGRGLARTPDRLAGKTLADVERVMVEAAMRECDGNKARAARRLGVPRSTLYALLARHGLA